MKLMEMVRRRRRRRRRSGWATRDEKSVIVKWSLWGKITEHNGARFPSIFVVVTLKRTRKFKFIHATYSCSDLAPCDYIISEYPRVVGLS